MSIPALSYWLGNPQGQYVLEWERARVEQAVTDIFGFNAVQLGFLECDYLLGNRMPNKFRCDDALSQTRGDVLTDLRQLPFPAASIDLVVLPHVLEFSSDPHQVLREVERVLVPDGHVVITGFNPYSLWGLRRSWGYFEPVFPWVGDYLSVPRLKDWCKLLSLETQAGWFGCYAPPVNSERWIQRWRFMEKAGDRWWPMFGGAYVIQAVKRVHGMRLIKPRLKDIKARAGALSPVVQRQIAAAQGDLREREKVVG